jgi:hypothetical protein
MSFYLKRKCDGALLGILYPKQSGDFPWMHCDFKPTHLFKEAKPLFEKLNRSEENVMNNPENEELQEKYEEIWMEVSKLYMVVDENEEEWTIGTVEEGFASIRV